MDSTQGSGQADSPSTARPALPLSDLRIIAIEQYGAGPFGSVHLADLGAEVIKIEDPRVGGDIGRYVPPYAAGEDSLFFETFNRNKRSLSLDLTVPEGREVFEDLVRNSDAVYSNLRGRCASEIAHLLRRSRAPQPADSVLQPDRFWHDRPPFE